ncbi:MAG TPA: hypothetical protein PLX33_10405 [Alphaproteobacteria bacterium]|nr:hypothetical protein [Alphaproteobacteria bacterium]
MTKVRPNKIRGPLTPEACVLRAVGILGLEDAAAITGKQPSTVYAYGDPDKEKHISVEDAIALDLACLSEVGEAPFTSMMRATVEAVDFRGRMEITDALLGAVASVGKLAETVRAAKCPTGPGGRTLTMKERRQIETLGASLLKQVHEIIASVKDEHAEEQAA